MTENTQQPSTPPEAKSRPQRGSLQPLFDPRAIAVLGASGDPEKLNGRTVRALVDKKFNGGIYPVNPKHDRIADLTCYPDVQSLPDGVDLAIVATPAAIVAKTLRELSARGVRAVAAPRGGETARECFAARRRAAPRAPCSSA